MRNRTAAVWESTSAHTLHRQNPDGDFAATYLNTPHGRATGRMTIDQIPMLTNGRLSQMGHGAFVILHGTIAVVRVFEHSKPYMPHSAMVRLESGTGAATYVRVSYSQYENVWGFLVMGRTVSLCGKVVRPEPNAPEHIDLARLWLAGSDVLTPESYVAQQAAAALAVNV